MGGARSRRRRSKWLEVGLQGLQQGEDGNTGGRNVDDGVVVSGGGGDDDGGSGGVLERAHRFPYSFNQRQLGRRV